MSHRTIAGFDRIGEENAFAVLARAGALAAQGRDIIHLEIGEPDFSTAPHISMVGIKAIADGKTRYNPPSGLKELRETIAEDAGRRRGGSFRSARPMRRRKSPAVRAIR